MFWTLCLNLVAVGAGLVTLTRPHNGSEQRLVAVAAPRLEAANNSRKSTFLRRKGQTGNLTASDQDPNRHFTLYGPQFGAAGSVILLAPWDGREGWWLEWLGPKWNVLTNKNWRVLEAVGKIYHHSDGPYRGWYHYDDWHNEIPTQADLDEAVTYVHGLIQQEFAIVQNYQRIVLAGYSQGAVLALESGLRFPSPLGLVFSQRGVLLETRLYDETPVAKSIYVFTAGSADNVYTEDWVWHCCNHAVNLGTSSFMKTVSGLDHYECSDRENNLLMDSISTVMSTPPANCASSIESFGGWTPCEG